MANSTRRDFLGVAGLLVARTAAALVLPSVTMPIMASVAGQTQHKDTDLIPDETPLPDPVVARKLLKIKVDYAFFHDPQVMKNVYAMFPQLPDHGTTLTQIAANKQIKNSVELDYRKSSGPKTWAYAKFYWKRRFGHRIYEVIVPAYDNTLHKLLEKEPNISALDLRSKANAEFVNAANGLCDPAKFTGECTMGRLLGREKFDAAGRFAGINDNWRNEPASLWDRPVFDFDRMFKVAGISPSPFNATWGDLAKADKAAAKHKELHKYDPADTDIGDDDDVPSQPADKKPSAGQTPSAKTSPHF